MTTTLYVYSGTGNSLFLARSLAAELSQAEIRPMKQQPQAAVHATADVVGLVFPVHIWGLAPPVRDFVERLETRDDAYLFALAVNAGQVSRTLIQLQECLQARGRKLQAGFSISMPSNYIPWGGPGPKDKQRQRIRSGVARMKEIAPIIRERRPGPIERGPLWQRILFTGLYKISYAQVPKMDKKFFADDRCNSCGSCQKICPADNISLVNDKPAWHHRCEQCFACLQWCPQQAIQYGPKTVRFERYQNPEIAHKDMLALVGKNADSATPP